MKINSLNRDYHYNFQISYTNPQFGKKLPIKKFITTPYKKFQDFFEFKPQYVQSPTYLPEKEILDFSEKTQKLIAEAKNQEQFIPKKALNPKIQRGLDITIASILSVPATIVVLTTGAIKKLSNKSDKILFIQQRIGENGKPIYVYKMCTMGYGQNGSRTMSKYTQLLRKFSIDELPQIWNVLKGDMSFMGPRSLVYSDLLRELNKETQEYAIMRCGVKPGFGFGYKQNNEKVQPNADVIKEFYHNRGLKRYFKTIFDLITTAIKGHNK